MSHQAGLFDAVTGTRLARLVLIEGRVRVERVEDRVLLLRLHALFLTPRTMYQRLPTGERVLAALSAGDPIHFAECLEVLISDGYRVELE